MILFQSTDKLTEDLVIVEDSGLSKQTEVVDDDTPNGLFVRLLSWDDHTRFNQLIGKTVKVTIEILD